MTRDSIVTPDAIPTRSQEYPYVNGREPRIFDTSGTTPEAVMIAEICAYEANTELYDEDCIKPTPYAFERIRDLLALSVNHITGSAFPLGTVYPDGSGALRVEWTRPDREVALVVFSNPEDKHYIFHKAGGEYGGDYNVTPESLGYYLEWLNNDEATAK